MICSVLESKICNTCLPLQKLKYYEDLIVNRVRKWLGLGTNVNRKFMFVARSKGGLGFRNPTNMYIIIIITLLTCQVCLAEGKPSTNRGHLIDN